MKKKSMSLIRALLKQELPILPGDSFSRPAPAHIFNKFVFGILGKGTLLSPVTKLFKDTKELDLIVGGSTDRETREEFLKSLNVLINSDKRSFGSPSFASYLLLTSELAGADPSDDDYGKTLSSIFTLDQRSRIEDLLKKILNPETSGDIISLTIKKLQDAYSLNKASDFSNNQVIVPSLTKSLYSEYIFNILVSAMEDMSLVANSSLRIESIQKLSTFLTGIVAFGLLFDSSDINLSTKRTTDGKELIEFNSKPSKVLGIVCYTGNPPGNPRSALVRLSQLSLKQAIINAHSGVGSSFIKIIEEANSKTHKGEDSIENLVLSRLRGEDARNLVKALSDSGAKDNPKEAFNELYPLSSFSSAFKTLSGKVGLAGPIKGTGEARIFFETNFLDSLVYFLSKHGDSFDDFVDNCFENLGIIVGKPSTFDMYDLERLQNLAGRIADVEECLDIAHESMRLRLVRSGLAKEFSDGYTIMVRNEL
jgi:hypothetical protein